MGKISALVTIYRVLRFLYPSCPFLSGSGTIERMAKGKLHDTLKKVKTVTICGKRYNFKVKRLKDVRGMTEHPSTKNKTVYIDDREEGKQLLATLLDEFIHCAIWEIGNDVVDEISDDIAEALWRCGLRFEDDSK